MRKFLGIGCVLVLCLAWVPTPASAQLGLGFGVKAGLNIADLKDLEAIDTLDALENEAQTGFVGGAYLKFPLGPFRLQAEGLYSVKGAKGTYRNSLGSHQWETKLTYLEFPLLMRYEMPTPALKPFFYGGASAAFLIKAEQRNKVLDSDWDEVDIKDDLKSADYSLIAGAGIELLGLTLEGRYTHGLSDPLDPKSDELLMNKAKNRTWSVMAGFDFF